LQKETAVKDEMNHEEKEKEFYQRRLKVNNNKQRSALPDEQVEYSKLATFDKDQAKTYNEELRQNQEKLNADKQMDMKQTNHMEQTVDKLKAKINMLKSRMNDITETEHVKETGLKQKQELLNKEIVKDEALDRSRQEETERTSKAMKHSGSALVKRMMMGSEGVAQQKQK